MSEQEGQPILISSEQQGSSMDADEALARALQEAEVAAARQQQPQPGSVDAHKAVLHGLISNSLAQALSVEDAELQARARALLPLDQLRHEAQEAADLNTLLGAPASSMLGLDDFLVQGLLAFFKRDFFTWVDQPACELCTCPTTGIGMAQPTAAEVQDGAGRVEAYSCSVCQQVTRFPRYTKPAKLLETRRGRCGEWAHTFLLVLRAVGLDARHVTDNADHVWCEYYSLALGRWVHVDPCEEAWDTPLLYEGGWGKSLAYVFGCSKHGAMDITRRYVLQPQALPALRSQVPEAWLAATLARLNSPLRAAMDTNARREAALREAAEALQLMSFEDDGSGAAAVAAANLPARQSGAQAWRSARGETGGEVTAQSRSAGHATSYQRAHDDALPPLFAAAGRITGGACRASGEHRGGQPSQQALRAFDGSLSSKWLDFGGGGSDGAAWLEYQLLPRQDAVILSHYDMVVAEDCPERDPRDWVLECIPERPNADTSSSGSSSNLDAGWVVLDQRCGEHFHRRHQLRSFLVPEAARIASRQWRLRITCAANPSTANSVQVTCLNLYSSIVALRVLHGQREQQQWHMQSSSLPQPQGMPLCLLYFSLDHWCNITRLLACGAAASDGDRASASELHDSVLDTECGVVQRIINNMFEYPNNAKFWQLGTRGSKIQPVLRHPSMLALLLQVGFRPMMDLSPEVSVTEQHVRLVADGSSRENNALLRALKE